MDTRKQMADDLLASRKENTPAASAWMSGIPEMNDTKNVLGYWYVGNYCRLIYWSTAPEGEGWYCNGRKLTVLPDRWAHINTQGL